MFQNLLIKKNIFQIFLALTKNLVFGGYHSIMKNLFLPNSVLINLIKFIALKIIDKKINKISVYSENKSFQILRFFVKIKISI